MFRFNFSLCVNDGSEKKIKIIRKTTAVLGKVINKGIGKQWLYFSFSKMLQNKNNSK